MAQNRKSRREIRLNSEHIEVSSTEFKKAFMPLLVLFYDSH